MTNTILFSLLLAVLLVVLLLYIITEQLRKVIFFLLSLDEFVTRLRQHKDSIKVKKVEL